MDTLKPITPLAMLEQIRAELSCATRYGLVNGQPVDPIDREKISTAIVLTELLIAAQKEGI